MIAMVGHLGGCNLGHTPSQDRTIKPKKASLGIWENLTKPHPKHFLVDIFTGNVNPRSLNRVCKSRSAFLMFLQLAAFRSAGELSRCPCSSTALRANRFTRLPLALKEPQG